MTAAPLHLFRAVPGIISRLNSSRPVSIHIHSLRTQQISSQSGDLFTTMHPTTPEASSAALRPDEGKFLYFAYGSNLLARRLLIMNPTAKRFGVGQLKGYRLDFSTPPSKRWGGAPATVVPDPDEDVWGAIWALDLKDRDNLDKQEGVGTGWYEMFNATALTPGGDRVHCRCYMMGIVPPKLGPGEARPTERQPSLVYKQVMLTGARESGLPEEYIGRLRAVHDNGSRGVDPPVSLESLPQSTTASPADAAR